MKRYFVKVYTAQGCAFCFSAIGKNVQAVVAAAFDQFDVLGITVRHA